MEELKNEETWNKKRIFIAIFLIIALIIGGYLMKTKVFGNRSLSPFDILKSVKGISNARKDDKTQEKSLSVNAKKALQDKINSLKQEVSGLNILEIASSSSQVQKILRDIKSLEQYPETQAKEICRKICGL